MRMFGSHSLLLITYNFSDRGQSRVARADFDEVPKQDAESEWRIPEVKEIRKAERLTRIEPLSFTRLTYESRK